MALPKTEPKFLPRLLPERSFLYYTYPQLGGKKNIEFYLPMLENIEVREAQAARVGRVDLLGRLGTLFTFQGANSRNFDVKFSFHLDHIAHYVHEVGLPEINFFNEPKRPQFNAFNSKTQTEFKLNYSARAMRDAYDSVNLESELIPTDPLPEFKGKLITKDLEKELANEEKFSEFGESVLNYYSQNKRNHFAVNYLILFLNVIRSSTIGNSENTSLGPPTIYLNHGTMYNNIPCICEKFSITLKNDSTYDLASLTPKTLEISLDLHENRTGDFGKFVPFKHVQGENLAGWECLIEKGTMDPYNYREKS